jgi:tol-pal system protein YbgF
MAVLSRFHWSVLTVALLATAPAFAQKVSLADRVSRLEQQSSSQSSTAGQANVELLNRLTQMQSEVQALRNQLEQLQNENEQLKQRNREQYVDLDTRLQRMEGGSAAPAGAAPMASRPGSAPAPRPGTAAPAAPVLRDPAAGPVAPAADEQASYSTAFAALRSGNYVESARGFQAYLRDFPNGSLAPNAWYWLGESYYVTQNYPVALQAFETLLSKFPDSGKAPDALLKRGYCQIEMAQAGPGTQTLNRVINEYPGTDAARLAASRLRALNLESR